MEKLQTKQQSTSQTSTIIGIVILIVLLVALHFITGGKLLTPSNIKTILVNASTPTFIALAFVFLQASGFTDLSLGAAIILGANVAGTFGNMMGYPGLLLGGLISGIILMTINFCVFQFTKIPSWIAGLGMTMIYETIAGYYSQVRVAQGLKVEALADEMRLLGRSPAIYIMLLVGFVIAYITYNKTSLGLNARAVGGSEDVAKMMGINTKRALLLGGLMAGFFFGFAGVLKESYAGYVLAQTGLSSLSTVFQPLAAVLLAQALQKYINIVVAIPISTFLIAMIFNVLTLLGVPSGTFQEFLLGAIVIAFGITAQRTVKGVVK